MIPRWAAPLVAPAPYTCGVTGEGTGRTALVTGASAGIGKAFAEVLAERGYGLVLTARRADRLQAVAVDLGIRFGVPITVHAADLADPAAPADLVAALEARGLHVDVLVNNAGYGVPGRYGAADWTRQRDFIQVLVVAVAELTHRLLPGMLARHWGRVVNIASLAALVPAAPGHTLYAASKAFLVKFSEALAGECVPDGVHVTAVCPGFTYSEFHDVTGTRVQVSAMPRWMWSDARDVALQGYAAAMAGTPVAVTGRVNRAIALGVRHLPSVVTNAAVRRTARNFRKL
ncbi:MAG: SDR family oxidoreductase [Acidobacteria bacterium]|nr:SDR family oxidoreductase [Acidobacteriota bacterium]